MSNTNTSFMVLLLISLQFYPVTGPREGGTNVTIVGQNLGKTFDDIRHSVIVARVICLPYEELYVPSKRSVCDLR